MTTTASIEHSTDQTYHHPSQSFASLLPPWLSPPRVPVDRSFNASELIDAPQTNTSLSTLLERTKSRNICPTIPNMFCRTITAHLNGTRSSLNLIWLISCFAECHRKVTSKHPLLPHTGVGGVHNWSRQ